MKGRGALVAIGTAGGALLASWITPLVARLALEQFGGVSDRDVRIGWHAIGLMAVAASACASICALVSARMASRQNVMMLSGVTRASVEIL